MSQNQGTLTFADRNEMMSELFASPYLVLLSVAESAEPQTLRLSIADLNHVEFGRGESFAYKREKEGSRAILRIKLSDGWMSTRHAELKRVRSSWTLVDLGSKNGTFLGGQKIESVELNDGDIFELGNSFWLFRSAGKRSNRDSSDCTLDEISTKSEVSRTLSFEFSRMLSELKLIADSDLSILIGGETGTGKELVARYVHDESQRRGAFVPVNCGGLSSNLIESEFFGHRKGAFSGASNDKTGYFQAAKAGTIFLDEIAELPLSTQASLLRVLQEKEVTPVGDIKSIPVDFRLIAASHVDLDEAVDRGHFRADLLQRIRGHQATLLSLRERREDFGVLLGALLPRFSHAKGCLFSRSVLRALFAYSWPGNVREFEQILGAMTALSPGGRIESLHLPEMLKLDSPPRMLSEDDKELRLRLIELMEKHQGNVSAVAREFDKARVQIRRWCKRLNVDPLSYKK